MSSYPFSWEGNLRIRCDSYFGQGLCCFDFAYICVVRCQWDQSLWRKTVNRNHINLLKQGALINVQAKLSTQQRCTFPPPCATTVPLSSCRSTKAKNTLP